MVIGWCVGCPICGKRFTPKISGHGSPCSTCNQRLIETQENLEALEIGKTEVKHKKFFSQRDT
jgi:hypothetical protein